MEYGKLNRKVPYPPFLKEQDGVDELTQQALATGISPNEILTAGLITGMNNIGVKFKDNKVFVPQVLMSAKAMSIGMGFLKKYFADGSVKRKGKFIIGTVEGDLHDIGKNLVSMMLEGNGYEVIDLEDCIWRLNQQVMNELHLNEYVIGRRITDLLEVVCDKKNVLEDLLLQLRERDVRIIPLDINCFIRELKSGISFLIQGAMVGIHEDGQLVRIVLYFRNVLEERTQKHLLNIALSRTQIFQWSFDMEHNLMIIEPRYFEYLGIPTRDYTLTPEEFAFLIHPDDRKGVFDALALQLHGNLYERPVEYRLRRGDGKWEWFEAQSTYVGQLTDLPFRIIGICMSTQKYKDTENKLNEALQKAQRSDELKSVFLANMSHEIRTPLNAIVGFSTLLACGDADLSRQEIMEFTSLIEKNSQLLMVLISDILDLSKIESNTMEFHFEKVSLNGILESIYSAQKMNLRKGVELLLDLPDRAAVIYTDPTRLGQVVNNLINNAVKFTAEGRITIGYRLKDFATLEVFVEDTGTGMSEEVLAHIFERFYKGDAFVQGTGLGLAICRTIVERFHGKIEVASTLGKGSRFAIVLPQEMRE